MASSNTAADLLSGAAADLGAAGIDSPRREAELLLAHAAAVPRLRLLTHPEMPLSRRVAADYRRLIARRAGHEPYAYIVGHKEFMSLELSIDHNVLVPRPESELLCGRALDFLAAEAGSSTPPTTDAPPPPASPTSTTGPRVLDVGTGSGALAVAIAHYHPPARVWAIDISPAAAATARRNVAKFGLGDRVTVTVGDLLAAPGLPPPGTADLVVANLPYVPATVFGQLARGVAVFEPRLALDGGPDGLAVIRRLLPQAAEALRPGGALGLECDPAQCKLLTELAGRVGFGRLTVHADLAGRARIVWGYKHGDSSGDLAPRPPKPSDRGGPR